MPDRESAVEFEWFVDPELSGGDSEMIWHFPRELSRGGFLLVRFRIGDRSWVGQFWGGIGGWGVTEAHKWPGRFLVGVFVNGRGFLVDARDPGRTVAIDCPFGIQQCFFASDGRHVLLANHSELCCYLLDTRRWTTRRLVLDELRVLDVGTTVICGGFLPGAADHRFDVRLEDGVIDDELVVAFQERMTNAPEEGPL